MNSGKQQTHSREVITDFYARIFMVICARNAAKQAQRQITGWSKSSTIWMVMLGSDGILI
jgi:hypothetical protein